MVKGIIENTHIISSKFIWFLSYYNFSKIDMYFETEEVTTNILLFKEEEEENSLTKSLWINK